MPSTLRSRLALSILLAACACSEPADSTHDAASGDAGSREDAAAAPIALTVVPTGARISQPIDADDGGTITLSTATRTYTLEVTSGALASDAEITLEEVTIPELPSALAVRFSPDGLVFQVPALLTVDAPYEVVTLGLAFRAGAPGVEMVHAAPHQGGLAMAIEHFSEAGFVPADEAVPVLDDEQAAATAAVTSRSESVAYGLGTLFRGRIARLVERADLRISELIDAATALESARAEMMLASVEGHDARPSGPPTVGALAEDASAEFRRRALLLYGKLTRPTCDPGRDVAELDDWARAVHRLRAALSVLALTPPPDAELCVSTRLAVLASPTSLAPTTDEVVLTSVTLELVGPGSEPEVQPLELATFGFAATGATGPDELASATGTAHDVRFTRPSGPDRPPVVSVVVTGHTTDTQLGALPQAPPVTVVVAEPAAYGGTVALNAVCRTPSTVSVTCGDVTTACEVFDITQYSIEATLRIVDALGGAPTAAVTAVHALRSTDHEVCESHAPYRSETLDASVSTTVVRQSDGRLVVSVCGPTATAVVSEDLCTGANTDSTGTSEGCFDLILRPTPTGATIPERFVPDPPATPGCAAAPSLGGELLPE